MNLKTKPLTDRQRIAMAFKKLRRHGYFARMNFKCCQGHGFHAIPEGRLMNYVYYHRQGAVALDVDGKLDPKGMYLYWNTPDKDATPIIQVLEEVGFRVSWEDDPSKAIFIQPTDPATEAALHNLEAAFNRS